MDPLPGGERRTLTWRYTFTLKDGAPKTFEVTLDYDTLQIVQPERAAWPEWTKLSHQRCPGCPLDEARHPRCPPAAALVDLIDSFRDINSFDRTTVRVEGPQRTYAKDIPAQNAVSSLIGLHMATSGCPVLDRLRPMADTHLPFASSDETTQRLLATYLVTQYFKMKAGGKPDWDLAGLKALLERIQEVDAAFCVRLRSIQIKDASLNALVILNNLSLAAGMALEDGAMERMSGLFRKAGE